MRPDEKTEYRDSSRKSSAGVGRKICGIDRWPHSIEVGSMFAEDQVRLGLVKASHRQGRETAWRTTSTVSRWQNPSAPCLEIRRPVSPRGRR